MIYILHFHGETVIMFSPCPKHTCHTLVSSHTHPTCVAVCCSMLQCVAVCCSVLKLQCVAVCCSVLRRRNSETAWWLNYSESHVECHLSPISDLNLIGLFSTERSKRDLGLDNASDALCRNFLAISTPQHVATRCNTLQRIARNTLQHTATHCNAPEHFDVLCRSSHSLISDQLLNICTTLQHTVTNCKPLQHAATHIMRMYDWSVLCNTLQHTATHCNTISYPICSSISICIYVYLQRTATTFICNGLQHTCTIISYPISSSKSICMYIYLQQTATILIRNTLRHNATHLRHHSYPISSSNCICIYIYQQHSASISICNILQHNATHCNTLHHTQHSASI